MVTIIDGSSYARQIVARVATEAEAFTRASGTAPGLAVVLVGSDPASEIYVRRKIAQCRQAGILSIEHRLPAQVDQATLLSLIADLNADEKVHGILVQLPLPTQIDADKVLDCISPAKDVDGFHPVNVGRLSAATPGLVPCTPLGCMRLLDTVISDFRGLHAVVIGKSNIVGKPVALMLLERECTVTVTHIYTVGLPAIARGADILVVAVGKPNLVRGDWVKPGGGRDRCRHQSRPGRRGNADYRRCSARGGDASSRHHACAGRCRANDHSLPSREHHARSAYGRPSQSPVGLRRCRCS